MSITQHSSSFEELRFRLGGELYEPDSEGYREACTLFNSMVEKRPALVARCVSPDDVAACLAYSRTSGMPVAVRGGGHSVTGASLAEDGLVIDLRGMRDVSIDPARRIARVGGGATWSDVDRAAQAHGLATTGGRVSTTGVGGLTLGGGSGWLERKHGLACDNLVGAELVTADSELLHVSETEHPELLWALRGGGGNFGVATTLELELHPMPAEVVAGLAVFGVERAGEILRAFRELCETAPEELGLGFAFITIPAEDEVPEELHGLPGVIVAGLYAGDAAEGERLLAPLRGSDPLVDFFERTTYADFQCSIDDPPGLRNYWTAEHLTELPDPAIDAIVERAGDLPAGASQLFIVPWGGAVARVDADASPVGGREASYVIHPFLLWDDPADDAANMAHGRSWRDVLAPWATGVVYGNFIGDEGDGRVRAGFAPGAYDRLAEVKRTWDPHNRLRGNQNIRPAGS